MRPTHRRGLPEVQRAALTSSPDEPAHLWSQPSPLSPLGSLTDAPYTRPVALGPSLLPAQVLPTLTRSDPPRVTTGACSGPSCARQASSCRKTLGICFWAALRAPPVPPPRLGPSPALQPPSSRRQLALRSSLPPSGGGPVRTGGRRGARGKVPSGPAGPLAPSASFLLPRLPGERCSEQGLGGGLSEGPAPGCLTHGGRLTLSLVTRTARPGVTRHARPGHRAGRAGGPGALERGDRAAVSRAGSCLFLSPLGPACGLRAPCLLQTPHAANGPATFPGDPPTTLLWGLSSLLTLPAHPQGPSQLLRGAKWPGYPLPRRSPSTCRPSYRDRQASPGRRAPRTCLEPRRQPWPLGTGSRQQASTSLGMGSPVQVRPWLCWLEDRVVSGSPVPSPCQGTPSPVPPRFRGS